MKKLYKVLFAMLFLMPTLAQAGTFQGTRDDFRDETIYFAMTTRFYDGDPMNNVLSWDKQDVQISKNDPDWRGDFAGLIKKLDYIKALGFTAIWITPVTQNASGEDYHGYHSMDFSSVDLRYESRKSWGSAEDVKFQDLIDAAHAKGLKIVLDIVLNHTSNFGEVHLNPLFTRNQNIKNQATPAGSLIPNSERLSNNYFAQDGNAQYQERFKFFKNPQYDKHNMYHHYGTGWNWDLPNRWWGQIAGDCVDLNTENDAVAQYLVDCYGKFIEMGVDGFRIDTTGHIARLTFNTQFIPQFTALFEKYKDKRADGSAYLMFGECCARFGNVIYRDQHNLSSHFYTWKSDQSLINQYKSHSSQAWWDTQSLNEGHDTPVGPMIDCESEKAFNKNSSNVFMQNGAWHTPDYSEYSGFSVIDFPMHYNFNSAGQAINIAKEGDKYYNDASYNVVYVDSHDYCPGPNDGTRFNGGTEQWAENLSLMFTFRGIPCIYYGSEVEFKKGLPIDVGGENNKTPRSQSGRAYFGEYLEGSVTASDFGVYQASGNVATTLNGDLAHHIRMLNKIRASVPALRKGQYTFDGCSANGGWAFKRAYNKGGVDSYALVCINGGATFNNVPAGNYVDLVTGQTYTSNGGNITVSAPTNKGQLRVLVKNWNGGRVAEEGKFMYTSAPTTKGGNPNFADKGVNQYWTAKDVVGNASVTFSPAGGSFKTETLTVTASLNSEATSGWYQIDGGQRVDLNKGANSQFTIGANMSYGQTVSVKWEATNGDETYNGTVTYKKVDPNAVITIYVTGNANSNIYAWNDKVEFAGAWSGTSFSALKTVEIDGKTFYYLECPDTDTVNVIFNDGSGQTADITGITEDTFFKYNGGSSFEKLENVSVKPSPKVTLSPNGGNFKTDKINVSATLNTASTSGWYKIGESNQVSLKPGETTTFSIGEGMNYGDKVTVSWSATDGATTNTGNVTFTKVEPSSGITIYVNSNAAPNLYAWNDNGDLNGAWPGLKLTKTTVVGGKTYYYEEFDVESLNIIFNMGGDDTKTADITGITSDKYYVYNSSTKTATEVNNPGEAEDPGTQEPTPDTPEGDFVIYWDNSGANWSTPFVHYWGGAAESNYPGVAMNKLSGNIWWYDLPSGTSGILFNAGDGDASKTNDFSAIAGHVYNKSGDQGAFNNGGGNPSTPDTPSSDNEWHIYFDNSNSNWSSVYVYAWNGDDQLFDAWPGKEMSIHPTKNYHHYTIKTDKDLTKYQVIFNNGGNGAQTSDGVYIRNHAVYSTSGDTGTTGVEGLNAEPAKASVWAAQAKIYVEAPVEMDITVVRIDGRYHIEHIPAGVHVIEGLPHGLYIVNGVKVLI